MTNRVFKIVPASSSTYIGFGVVFLLMLIPFVALSIQCYKDWGNSTVDFWVGISGLVLIAGVAAIFGFFGYSARNSKAILSEKSLTIKKLLYHADAIWEDKIAVCLLGLYSLEAL